MPSTYTHNLVATIGTYTDRKSGQEKKRYLTVGKGFTDEQGRLSFKLDSLPVGDTWNGWLSAYPAENFSDNRQQNYSSAPSSAYPSPPSGHRPAQPPSHTPTPYDDTDEDIPF
jgi:single-stranded DNA-binding protein